MKHLNKLTALFLSLALCLSLFAACSAPQEDATDSSSEPAIQSTAASEVVTQPTQSLTPLEAPPALGSAYGSNAATALSHYGIAEAAPGDDTMMAVVAVDKDNNSILRNSQMQFYFWEELYQMQDYYGEYYMAMFGLSVGKPLTQQNVDASTTWEQYFVEAANATFSNFFALSSAAKANGYTLTAENQELLDYYTTLEGGFAEEIAGSYSSLEEYLKAFYGPGVALEDYREYLELYLLATGYYNDRLYTPVAEALTEAEVSAYYDENADQFIQSGVTKVNNVTVRHILIQPETAEGATEPTQEAWTAAEAEAQRIYDLWQADPTEENFAALANEHSSDGGSNTKGGIYENFAPGQMVAEFNDWSFDQSRKAGDHTIVKTTYGYHIMYFVKQTDTQAWYDKVVSEIAGTAANEALEELKKEYPVYFDFTQVRIYDIITNVINNTATEEK